MALAGHEGISRADFFRLLKEGADTAAPSGKADWEAIIKEAKTAELPFTATQFYQRYVKGVVTPQRSKGKLAELFARKQIARIYYGGRYYFTFDPEMIEAQQAEE